MANALLETAWQYYDDYRKSGDPRVNDMFLIYDPIYVVLLVLGYFAVLKVGPVLMRNREPFQLRKTLVAYDFFLVSLSFWMMYEFFVTAVLNPDYDLVCHPIEPEDRSELTMRRINVSWWYFFSKIIEFWDTFFFILRKKDSQISFLHVYHHSSVLLLEYMSTKFIPGGVYFASMFNCFIHCVMYSYYMLAAFGEGIQKYLWWKRYLTRMQMIQFVCMFTHSAWGYTRNCGFPKKWFIVLNVYVTTLLVLFGQFYLSSYVIKRKKEKSM